MIKKIRKRDKEKQEDKIVNEIKRLKKLSEEELNKEKYKLIACGKTNRNYKNVLSGFTILVTIIISFMTIVQGIDSSTTVSTDAHLRYMYDKKFELYKLEHSNEEYIDYVNKQMKEYNEAPENNLSNALKLINSSFLPIIALYIFIGVISIRTLKKADKASICETLVIFINDELERRNRISANVELKESIKDDICKLQIKSIEIEESIKYIEKISKSIFQ